ncbi:MAG: caspase family protein [Chlorobia bacterium]|nr:caspase family protein [Fimbriimonadaceae bacterium]
MFQRWTKAVVFAAACLFAIAPQEPQNEALKQGFYGIVTNVTGSVDIQGTREGKKMSVSLIPKRHLGIPVYVGDRLIISAGGTCSILSSRGRETIDKTSPLKPHDTPPLRQFANEVLAFLERGGQGRGGETPVFPADGGAIRGNYLRLEWNSRMEGTPVKAILVIDKEEVLTVPLVGKKSGEVSMDLMIAIISIQAVSELKIKNASLPMTLKLKWSDGATGLSEFVSLSKGKSAEIHSAMANATKPGDIETFVRLNSMLKGERLWNEAFDLAMMYWAANPENLAILKVALHWAEMIGDTRAKLILGIAKRAIETGTAVAHDPESFNPITDLAQVMVGAQVDKGARSKDPWYWDIFAQASIRNSLAMLAGLTLHSRGYFEVLNFSSQSLIADGMDGGLGPIADALSTQMYVDLLERLIADPKLATRVIGLKPTQDGAEQHIASLANQALGGLVESQGDPETALALGEKVKARLLPTLNGNSHLFYYRFADAQYLLGRKEEAMANWDGCLAEMTKPRDQNESDGGVKFRRHTEGWLRFRLAQAKFDQGDKEGAFAEIDLASSMISQEDVNYGRVEGRWYEYQVASAKSAAASAPPNSPIPDTIRQPKSKAILIINDTFDQKQMWPKLNNPQVDGKLVGDALSGCGFDVERRVNTDYLPIMQELHESIRDLRKGEQLLIYVVGHASAQAGGFFALKGTGANAENAKLRDRIFYKSLATMMKMNNEGQILLVIDACSGGEFLTEARKAWSEFQSRAPGEATLEEREDFVKQLSTPCRYVIASGIGRVPDGQPGQGSAFAGAFAKSITSRGPKSFIKIEDVTTTLRRAFDARHLPTQPIHGSFLPKFGGFVWLPK